MEEVLEHLQNRVESRSSKSELARKIKKLSSGRKLSHQDMIELIKDQLGENGRNEMESMLKEGKSIQEVIEYFMNSGKTQEEEHREIGEKLLGLIRNKELSKEELKDLMISELNASDKAQMEQMLKQGCSVDEVFNQQ